MSLADSIAGEVLFAGMLKRKKIPWISPYISVPAEYVQTKAMKKESVMNNLIPAIHF